MQTTLPRVRTRNWSFAWLGVVPFFAFAFFFLILPAGTLLIGSVQDQQGNLTLENFRRVFEGVSLNILATPSEANILGLTIPLPLTVDFQSNSIISAYILSIQLSVATALIGGVLGFLLAYAVVLGGLPPAARSALLTFSGVASYFSGVPLAFAFIATLGRLGFVTTLIRNIFGFDLYQTGFSVLSLTGLILTYTYFQFPLMVLIITPALDGLKREWREAAENLGASDAQYWRHVAFPILLPSLLGTMILLFSNAFGAVATPYALTGGNFQLATILIFRQIRGEVLQDPGLGYAVALGMVLVMAISLALYYWLQRRSERWLKR